MGRIRALERVRDDDALVEESSHEAEPLPCALVSDLERLPTEGRWLIEGLWLGNAVGIVGGSPKTGKSWFGLELAVSVASGAPALGRFQVPEKGAVIVFPAEDDPRAVRERIEAISAFRGLPLAELPIHVITADSLLLDTEEHRASLEELLAEIRPKLLLLDPLVRLHSGDENSASHVSQLLGYLRVLQRKFSLSIILTHHVAKRANTHPGQALRGSGDLFAWCDSFAALTRDKSGAVTLTLQHRSAPSPEPMALRLIADEGFTHLEIVEQGKKPSADGDGGELELPERVLALLRASPRPLSQKKLRARLKVRNQKLTETLRDLELQGRIKNEGRQRGWCLVKRAGGGDSLARDASVP